MQKFGYNFSWLLHNCAKIKADYGDLFVWVLYKEIGKYSWPP